MIRARVRLRILPGKDVDADLGRLEQLANDPTVMVKVMQDTIRQSLLLAFYNRFKSAESVMQDTQKADPSPTTGELSTGLFTPRMREVLAGLVTVSDPQATPDGFVLGIGPLQQLNSVRTPSHGEITKGKPTRSRYTVLWRQLEFGTGVFAKPQPRAVATRTKEPDGSWWYGAQAGQGLHLLGTRPGNFLRQASGLPYTQDAQNFATMFQFFMRQALFGR